MPPEADPLPDPDRPNGRFHEQVVMLVNVLGFKTKTDLHRDLREFLLASVVGPGEDLVHETVERVNEELERHELLNMRAKATMAAAISENPWMPLTNTTFQYLVARLQLMVDLRTYECVKKRKDFVNPYAAIASLDILRRLGQNNFEIAADWILKVYPPKKLAARNETPVVRPIDRQWYRLAVQSPPPIAGEGDALSQIRDLVPQLDAKVPELAQRLQSLLVELEGRISLQPGDHNCFEIYLELTAEQVKTLTRAMEVAQVSGGPQIILHRLGSDAATTALRKSAGKITTLDSNRPGFASACRSFLDRCVRRDRWMHPWRRLRFLHAPRARFTPIAGAIAASGQRYYSAPWTPELWLGILRDWSATIVLWPAFTALLVLVAAGVLAGFGIAGDWGVGLACGLGLACAGAQPCSYVLGVGPCAAGSVAMGFSFSVATALILKRLPDVHHVFATAIAADPFSAVLGGVIGLSAPHWRPDLHFSGVVIAGSIAGMWGTIVLSGWLMSQPRRASPLFKRLEYRAVMESNPTGRITGALASMRQACQFPAEKYAHRPGGRFFGLLWRVIVSVVLGGGGIGLAKLCTDVLTPPGPGRIIAFTVSFAVLGGLASAAVVYRRTGAAAKSGAFFIMHTLLMAVLCWAAFAFAGTTVGLVALAVACGVGNSTFFTAAYISGEMLGGLEYAETVAVWAATIESLGFVGAVLAGVLKS